MDKYLCRKEVYDELLEKAMRDRSHLTEKVITDKNGHQRKVLVRAGEEPKKQRTKKGEEPAEKKTAKTKHSEGDTVTLDGAKGDFKVSSIDKDGAYHVVSADGKKGYKVSENHITSNKGNAENKKEIDFEKKNNASKTEENARKNDAENNVNDAIKLSDAEKKEITDTFTPGLLDKLKGKESTTIGNIILNNLYSTGKKDLFNKIRKQEWDYKDANNKHGNTFNSDYAIEAMYQLYQENQRNSKPENQNFEGWGDVEESKKETKLKLTDLKSKDGKGLNMYLTNLDPDSVPEEHIDSVLELVNSHLSNNERVSQYVQSSDIKQNIYNYKKIIENLETRKSKNEAIKTKSSIGKKWSDSINSAKTIDELNSEYSKMTDKFDELAGDDLLTDEISDDFDAVNKLYDSKREELMQKK